MNLIKVESNKINWVSESSWLLKKNTIKSYKQIKLFILHNRMNKTF